MQDLCNSVNDTALEVIVTIFFFTDSIVTVVMAEKNIDQGKSTYKAFSL